MKLSGLLLTLVCLAGCSQLRPATTVSSTGEVTIKLTRRAYDDPNEAMSVDTQPSDFRMTPNPTPPGYTFPPGVTVGAYFQFIVDPTLHTNPQGKQDYKRYSAVLTSSKPGGVSDAVYVDWNNDKVFSADERAPLVNSPGAPRRVYKPDKLPRDLESAGPLIVVDNAAVYVVPGYYYEGAFETGGKSYGIRLIDSDMNGKLHPEVGLFSARDIIGIDYDGDGKIKMTSSARTDYPLVESHPFKPSVLMPDGLYYIAEVSQDNATLTLKPDPTPTGKVRLSSNFIGNGAVNQGDNLEFAPKIDGAWILHTGSYQVAAAQYVDTAPNGDEWIVNLAGYGSGGWPRLEVTSDHDQILEGKGPYRMQIQQMETVGAETFMVWVSNGAQSYVCPILHKDGTPPPMGTLTIKNDAGKTIATLPLRAWGPNYEASWSVNNKTRGKFHIHADWTLSLFGHLTADMEFVRR